MTAIWSGVFPAVTTKMKQDGAVDIDAMRASIDRLIVNGVSGVIVLPMLGENPSLSLQERETVIRNAVEVAAGRVPVLSGLAEATLPAAQANAKLYKEWGAQGLMVFPSIGYKTDPRETAHWYREVAKATPLPIMIYNNPIAYGVDVTPEILAELVDVPELVCVKEESGDVRRILDIRVTVGDRFAIFCGVDDQIVESMALGVTGWVSGMTNVWPKQCVDLFEMCRAQDFAKARELYTMLITAFHLDTHVKLVQYIKLAQSLVDGSPEWARSPRLPLIGDERAYVIDTIEAAKAALAKSAWA